MDRIQQRGAGLAETGLTYFARGAYAIVEVAPIRSQYRKAHRSTERSAGMAARRQAQGQLETHVIRRPCRISMRA
jgi:hypothetical protein